MSESVLRLAPEIAVSPAFHVIILEILELGIIRVESQWKLAGRIELTIKQISHGGSALKNGGQAGAGAAELPMEVFKKAVVGVVEEVKKLEGEA